MSWTQTREAFLDHITAGGASQATVDAYESDLKQFETFMVGRERPQPGQVSNDDLAAFLFHLESSGRSLATRARKLSCLRVFGEYLLARGFVPANPASGITLRRGYVHLDEHVLDYVAMRELINQVASGTRDRCILELFVVGLKSSEIVRLKREHLDLVQGTLVVGERTVVLTTEAIHELEVYLAQVWKDLKFHHTRHLGLLFVNYAGRNISRQALWKLVRELREDLCPQTLRRSAIIHMLVQGHQEDFIREQIGMEAADTISRYRKLAVGRRPA